MDENSRNNFTLEYVKSGSKRAWVRYTEEIGRLLERDEDGQYNFLDFDVDTGYCLEHVALSRDS